MEVIPRYGEIQRSLWLGLLVVLATSGIEVVVRAQGVGDTQGAASTQGVGNGQGSGSGQVNSSTQGVGISNARPLATRPPSSRLSYNRLTTGRQAVVSTQPRVAQPGAIPAASGRMAEGVSLHPYSDRMRQAQATGVNPDVPSGSSMSQASESPPAIVRSTAPHNFYPGMRSSRYPNANTAQITRGAMGPRHICVPNRGAAISGGIRGR